MAIPPPPLDGRDYGQLLAGARALARERAPQWTDMSAGDPGEVLLELFAYLTEALVYRVDRLPERMYAAFLDLIGASLEPPSAADAVLRFTRTGSGAGAGGPVPIPRGTRVGAAGGGASSGGASRGGSGQAGTGAGGAADVFATVEDALLPAGADHVDVRALACEQIEGELLGASSGMAGQVLRLARPPVVARANRRDQPVDPRDLSIGVEAGPGEPADLRHAGVAYRLWQEAPTFAGAGPDDRVYLVDRASGTIAFGPGIGDAAGGARRSMGAVPAAGRAIRAWYRRGGGAAGNVAAGTLTRLLDPVAGVSVVNPAPATGGRDVESVAAALIRGPAQLFSLQRAVTARDFELAARSATGAVTRARALTQTDIWAHGTPGAVEVLLVPAPPNPGAASAATLVSLQTDQALERVAVDLDGRRALGTQVAVSWARYKTVSVRAAVTVHPAADPAEVHGRLVQRLQRVISPVATDVDSPGWPFGQALRASDVFATLLAEPSVRYVEDVELSVDAVPDARVRALAADLHQPRTWFCASGPTVFRSMDDGDGWEASGSFDGETVECLVCSEGRPGLVAASSVVDGSERSRLRVSSDCGETWSVVAETEFHVEDMTVLPRSDRAVLMLATDRGLFELVLGAGGAPTQVLVDPADQTQGYYAVAHAVTEQGDVSLAVAAQGGRGVLLSTQGGRAGTFAPIGLQGRDVRVLAVRRQGPRRLLLAGVTVESGDDAGEGAHMIELRGAELPPGGWAPLTDGWTGGSCRALAVAGDTLVAASHRLGALRWDLRSASPSWRVPSVDSGLPLRDLPSGETGRFEPVRDVAAAASGDVLLAGGPRGVYRSTDAGATFANASQRVFRERVTLPPTWLFCSGSHELQVRDAPV
jgi:hypothetical protein